LAKPFEIDEPKFSHSPLGEQRLLVICLPESATIKSKLSDPLYASLDWPGFEERDLSILEFRKYSSHLISEHPKKDPVPRAIVSQWGHYATGSEHKKISKIAKCQNKLEYVLIGKDETQKRRWSLFPSDDDLYSIIDAMPMRRYEMRQRADKN